MDPYAAGEAVTLEFVWQPLHAPLCREAQTSPVGRRYRCCPPKWVPSVHGLVKRAEEERVPVASVAVLLDEVQELAVFESVEEALTNCCHLIVRARVINLHSSRRVSVWCRVGLAFNFLIT